MPNIMVFGVGKDQEDKLIESICTAIKAGDSEIAETAVVTIVQSRCLSVKDMRKEMPFLRISSTNPLHTNKLKNILAPLQKPWEIDVEVGSPITEFIEAPK